MLPLFRPRFKHLGFILFGFVCLNFALFLMIMWNIFPHHLEQSHIRFGEIFGMPASHFVTPAAPLWLLDSSLNSTLERHKEHISTAFSAGEIMIRAQRSACMFRTQVDFQGKILELKKQPFISYTQTMWCMPNGMMAVFGNKCALLLSAIVDSSKTNTARKGGEKMDETWNQTEADEYFSLLPGFFKVPCRSKPVFGFDSEDHLRKWGGSLECYHEKTKKLLKLPSVLGTTLAVQRYEYVNLYHAVCDFYNAFVMTLFFGVSHSKMNVLFVDAHPEGDLDKVWETLFGNTIRAGRLSKPALFERMIWSLQGYSSPLNIQSNENVPFLEDFRNFVLSRYNVSTTHTRDCRKLNVVIIWRHDYVAHPRNPKGRIVRKFQNEEEILQQAQRTMGPGSHVLGVQLDRLPMGKQLEMIAACDILVGMHGAGLSHTLFLPPTSALFETVPMYFGAYAPFGAMARWRKLPYRRWHNKDRTLEKDQWRTRVPSKVIHDNLKALWSVMCG